MDKMKCVDSNFDYLFYQRCYPETGAYNKNEINTIFPTGGLCNRLRVIFSWLQYSTHQNKSLRIVWEPSEECPGMFLDYFKCPPNCIFINNDIDTEKTYAYKGCLKHPLIQINKNTYKDLTLKDDMSLLLNGFIDQYGHYDSIHIRRTDLDALLKRTNRAYTTDDIFIDFIDRSNNMVYLATDNINTQIKYHKLFPHKILIRHFIRNKDQLRQTSIKNAILDAFLCINSKSFLGTYYSSFSNFITCMRTNN